MAKSKKRKEIEYAIKYLHDTMKLQTKDIALELGIAEAIVDGVINEPKEEKPRKVSKVQNMMIRHTSSKKTNNVSIMTEGASQLSDELRNKISHKTSSKSIQNSIYRPNG